MVKYKELIYPVASKSGPMATIGLRHLMANHPLTSNQTDAKPLDALSLIQQLSPDAYI